MTVADRHQLKILKDTIRNPMMGLLNGPSQATAVHVLKTRFGYTDKQIDNLRS